MKSIHITLVPPLNVIVKNMTPTFDNMSIRFGPSSIMLVIDQSYIQQGLGLIH